jgi:nucleotide-binding universal stress UspA family protein
MKAIISGVGASRAPVVAAVEPPTAPATADKAARLARELGAPLAFVSVRPGPAVKGCVSDRQRMAEELVLRRKALDTAIAAASSHGVMSSGEIVEGDPATQIVQFAATRNAHAVVVGPRRRAAETSVARQVIALSRLPVVVAAKPTSRRGHAGDGTADA